MDERERCLLGVLRTDPPPASVIRVWRVDVTAIDQLFDVSRRPFLREPTADLVPGTLWLLVHPCSDRRSGEPMSCCYTLNGEEAFFVHNVERHVPNAAERMPDGWLEGLAARAKAVHAEEETGGSRSAAGGAQHRTDASDGNGETGTHGAMLSGVTTEDPMPEPANLDADAVDYVLRRIATDPNVSYYMGKFTESLERLCRARAARTGQTWQEVEKETLGHPLERKADVEVLKGQVQDLERRLRKLRGEAEL